MASSPKVVSFVFLILTLFFTQIHARESRFFSKVSSTTTIPATINKNDKNVKDTTLPTKEEDQQPEFLPETQSYGLYDQKSSVLPTTGYFHSYEPETTQNQDSYSKYPNRNANYYYYNNNNNAYDEQQEKLGETSLHEAPYTTTSTHNNNNNNYYYHSEASEYSNPGKQGMSDTKFLENGKYYYDVKNENNYYPNEQYPTSKYNYNPGSYYGKNGDSYEYNSNGGRYQSQNDFQAGQYVP